MLHLSRLKWPNKVDREYKQNKLNAFRIVCCFQRITILKSGSEKNRGKLSQMVLNKSVDGDGSPLVKLRADNQAVTILVSLLKTINFCDVSQKCLKTGFMFPPLTAKLAHYLRLICYF